ncbi:hypothetical protein [Pseudoalteromonas viridis]|uniref:Tail fiber protein n=1 Tax=Pseudoalteromonas viridis TaxID=339617 RepID=A0ABX7V0S1_9GAMM|nr:hypothetical protein [Pseudoalteromonas viridis]QTL34095.1 hypothetical protein J5X90_10960 [Pseudoalteromonas viridis]
MSNSQTMSLDQRIAALQQTNGELVASNNTLTQTVTGKMGEINSALADSKAEVTSKLAEAQQTVDDYVANARRDNTFIRLTKNQFGYLTASGLMQDFTHNPALSMSFEVYRTIESGILWADRDEEEKEILTAMGLTGRAHFKPAPIRIIRMRWQDAPADKGAHAFYQVIHSSNRLTCASYAKLVSGSIYGTGFHGITDEWGLCGNYYGGKPGTYLHCHPYINSPSGEVLFAWFGVVSGFVPLDRDNPVWGYYPHIAASHGEDVTV